MIFLAGLFFYVKDPHRHHRMNDNVLVKFMSCVFESSKRRWIIHRGGKFLENIQDLYEEDFVQSVRSVLEIIKLFLPLPIYWALLAQQDSSWTFQATKMDTIIGQWRIEPDQMKAVAPLMLLAMIPAWDKVLLPAIHKFTRMEITPVASITLGGIAAAASFIASGFLEIVLQVRDYFCFTINLIQLFLFPTAKSPKFNIRSLATSPVLSVDDWGVTFGYSGDPVCLHSSATVNEISGNCGVVHKQRVWEPHRGVDHRIKASEGGGELFTFLVRN